MTQAGYSGTPLPKKLGIRDDSRVLLAGAVDEDAVTAMGPLAGVALHRRAGSAPYDVIVLFVRDRNALERRFLPLVDRLTTPGGLWVAWPKRSSGIPTDLDENVIRDVGLATGLVDNKVCAVTDVWSGLRFVRRVRDR
jgi:hypothetical protein